MRRHVPPIAIAVLLLGCAAEAPRPPVAPGAAEGGSNAGCGGPDVVHDALLARVNAARAEARRCGHRALGPAAPVTWSPVLARIADGHAADMAGNDFVAHEGSDGLRVDRRADRAGFAWRAIGENVAAGAPDVARTVRQWLDSPGHCRNLMNRDYTVIGGACRAAEDTRYRSYWVLVLGDRQPD
jgi:uncharacterized protein YkwD